jgi:hypothetical protein
MTLGAGNAVYGQRTGGRTTEGRIHAGEHARISNLAGSPGAGPPDKQPRSPSRLPPRWPRPGPRPRAANLPYEVAFQGGNGDLWTQGSSGGGDLGFGMMPGTCPALIS